MELGYDNDGVRIMSDDELRRALASSSGVTEESLQELSREELLKGIQTLPRTTQSVNPIDFGPRSNQDDQGDE